MSTNKNFIPILLASLWLGTVAPVSAQSAEPEVTLNQAMLTVQQQTNGTVLSAEPHRIGRRLEYRIKVLTPDGHVRVMAVSSEASKNPVWSPSTKNLPGKNAGSKEKH